MSANKETNDEACKETNKETNEEDYQETFSGAATGAPCKNATCVGKLCMYLRLNVVMYILL